MFIESNSVTDVSYREVDCSGRQIRPDKSGYIADSQPNILARLSLTQSDCLALCTELEKKPRVWVRTTARLHHAKTEQRLFNLCFDCVLEW